MSDLDALAAGVLDAHRDAVEAARVAHMCQTLAGLRLLEIRDGMTRRDWERWCRSPECPLSRGLVARYLAAAAEHEEPEGSASYDRG